MAGMPVHGLIRLVHLAQAEVVRPALQFPVESRDLLLLVEPGPSAVGQFADLATESLDHFRGRARPDVGLARLRRVAPADRIAQKVERLLGYPTQPRLGLVDRQLQLGHHAPHRGHRLIGRAPTADHESSSPGEFHPQALTEPDGSLSTHPALITRPMAASSRQVPPNCLVDLTIRLGDWAPSLYAHYRHFNATTSPSAPVPRFGTLALVGPPLGLLPSHRGDRFPGSMFEPESDSRHLHAGRHAGGMRISPALIPEQRLNPGLDVVPTLSTRHQWFPCGRLSDSHLTRSRRAFSLTLTTGALDPSRSRWFGACLRRPAPRGLPSSRTHIAWRTVAGITDQGRTPFQAGFDRLLEPCVQDFVEVGIGQGGRNHAPLGAAGLEMRDASFFQHARVEPFADQSQKDPVTYPLTKDRLQVAMVQSIEKLSDVDL